MMTLPVSKSALSQSNHTFNLKDNFEVNRNVVLVRSQSFKVKVKEKDTSDIWKRPPLDFTWKLYQPKPLKR